MKSKNIRFVGYFSNSIMFLYLNVFYLTLDVGKKVNQAGTVGAVESVKSASDIYSPLSGEVVEVNENLKVIKRVGENIKIKCTICLRDNPDQDSSLLVCFNKIWRKLNVNYNVLSMISIKYIVILSFAVHSRSCQQISLHGRLDGED